MQLAQRPQRPGVFVLLPILNEAENIGPLLDQIEGVLTGYTYTIGIQDDGSSDGTLEYLAERMRRSSHHLHLIRGNKTTRGSRRGGALHSLLLWGLQNTPHEIFVEMDGDLSHRPEELPQGIQLIAENTCDLAIASKYIRGGQTTRRSFGRRLVSRVCSFAMRILLGWRIHDYSNGYRFYSRAAARLVAEHHIRYTSPIYLSEVLALWLGKGLRVREFPTTYVGRDEGLSKLRFVDYLKGSLGAFEIALRLRVTGFSRAAPSSDDVRRRPRPDGEPECEIETRSSPDSGST